jgi:predicted branched-subunit amino acid permease
VTTSTGKSAFRRGFLDGLPFVLTGAPFGLLFGVVATEAGLKLYESMSMSVLVIAGASQLTALAQMQEQAPVLLVIAAALAVNLRMAIYSAALAPHIGGAPFWQRALAAYILVDNAYATSIAEYEKRPEQPVAVKMAYFFGTALPVWVAWYLSTLAGALIGRGVPDSWALDFALPVAFLAILAPMVRTLAHLVAALVSLAASLALAVLPFNTELLVAAVLAMMAGAEVERRRGR